MFKCSIDKLSVFLLKWRGEARVNQSCLTDDIWLRKECSNTIPDRSKGQHNQLRDARGWLKGGTQWLGLY